MAGRLDPRRVSEVTLEAVDDMIIWIDAEGRIVFANASARRHFERLGLQDLSKPIYEIDQTFTLTRWSEHWRELEARRSFRFETEHVVGSGRVPIEVCANFVHLDGRFYKCGVFHDISERKQLERQLEEALEDLKTLSLTDALSGVGNRREFDTRLAHEFGRHASTGAPLSLILADVDAFKAFNDTYGHLAGDDCLRRIAVALRQSLHRETDRVARFGGEEFSVILPVTSERGAVEVAERMRQAVAQLGIAHEASKVAPVITASFGVATMFCRREGRPTALIEIADHCLYEAKALGRNRVVSRDLTRGSYVAA